MNAQRARVLQDIMLLGLGEVEWTGGADEALIVTAWTALTTLDVSHNSITNIDESVVSTLLRLGSVDLLCVWSVLSECGQCSPHSECGQCSVLCTVYGQYSPSVRSGLL